MKLSLLWVGKTRDRRLEALAAEYIERIQRYCRLDVREVREEPRDAASTPRERVEREGRKILKALRPGEHGIALDERGAQMSSEEFASLLGGSLEGHPGGVVLIMGGPYGLSDAVREKASRLVTLSKMTLTHEMARLVALEQVYRAFTILRGGRYHH
jgi:23S rRNA (pseudouridine1915-N3)-methyltransferase